MRKLRKNNLGLLTGSITALAGCIYYPNSVETSGTPIPVDVGPEIESLNRAPIAHPITEEAFTSFVNEFDLIGEDPDGDKLEYFIVENPAGGRLRKKFFNIVDALDFDPLERFSLPTVVYSPNITFLGVDKAKYGVSDGREESVADITFIVKNEKGGDGGLSLPSKFDNLNSSWKAEIVLHDILKPERIAMVDEGSAVFVERVSSDWARTGNSESVSRLFSKYTPELEEVLWGNHYVAEGAGDPWGNIQNTAIGVVDKDRIFIYRKTYISENAEIVNFKERETISYPTLLQSLPDFYDNDLGCIKREPFTNNLWITAPYTFGVFNFDSRDFKNKRVVADRNEYLPVSFAFTSNGDLYLIGTKSETFLMKKKRVSEEFEILENMADLVDSSTYGTLYHISPLSESSLLLSVSGFDRMIELIGTDLIEYDVNSREFSFIGKGLPIKSIDSNNGVAYTIVNNEIIRLQRRD